MQNFEFDPRKKVINSSGLCSLFASHFHQSGYLVLALFNKMEHKLNQNIEIYHSDNKLKNSSKYRLYDQIHMLN